MSSCVAPARGVESGLWVFLHLAAKDHFRGSCMSHACTSRRRLTTNLAGRLKCVTIELLGNLAVRAGSVRRKDTSQQEV